MRIVAGRHRGRRLTAPEGLAVRPTGDRTREALFDILTSGRAAPALEGAQVLDAFAGTGALGLEALSRGAARVTFMESLSAALAALKHNIAALDEDARCRVLQADVLRPPAAEEDDAPAIVLMDPPYGQGLAAPALEGLAAAGWIGPETLVVIELMAGESLAPPPGFALRDSRKYGQARLVFLSRG